jgi:glycosyltransferase involved in cell wall biosynthesis
MLHPNSFVQSRHAILPAWEYPKPNDAVTALLSDENLQRKIRDSGYSIFRENHSAEVVGRRLLEVLESIAQ